MKRLLFLALALLLVFGGAFFIQESQKESGQAELAQLASQEASSESQIQEAASASSSQTSETSQDGSNQSDESDAETKSVPKIPNSQVMTADGEEVDLHSLMTNGKPTIINVWAAWCPPCQEEMPYFQTAYDQYKDQFNFIIIDGLASKPSETMETAQAFLADNNLTLPVYYDVNRSTQIKLGMNIFPTTILFDKDGNRQRINGQISQDQLMAFLEANS